MTLPGPGMLLRGKKRGHQGIVSPIKEARGDTVVLRNSERGKIVIVDLLAVKIHFEGPALMEPIREVPKKIWPNDRLTCAMCNQYEITNQCSMREGIKCSS